MQEMEKRIKDKADEREEKDSTEEKKGKIQKRKGERSEMKVWTVLERKSSGKKRLREKSLH